MAGYIGNKSQTLVDGYTKAAADDEFVNDPNSVITVSGSSVGVGTASPSDKLHVIGDIQAYQLKTAKNYVYGADNYHILLEEDNGNTHIGNINGAAYFSSCGYYYGSSQYQLTGGSTGGGALYMQGDGNIRFLNASGQTADSLHTPTERMRITSAGNVGIGTASPNNKFHIANSGGSAILEMQRTNTNSTGGIGAISFTALDGHSAAGIVALGDGNDEGAHLTFKTTSAANSNSVYTSPTERMRIDSAGRILFGTTTAGGSGITAYIRGSAGGTTSYFKFDRNATTTAGTVLAFYNGGTAVGGVTHNSTSTSFNTSSDYRLKEDWQPMMNASTRVEALKPVNFAWKASGDRVDGFLAHELAEVIPEAVTGEKDAVDDEGNPEYQGIDQSKIVPLLTAALQEALARIDTLEAKVATLEGGA